MATITAARREADGSVVLTVLEERELIIAARDAAKGADLKALAKTQYDAKKLAAAEATVAASKGGKP